MENYQWQKMLLFNFNYPKSTDDKRNLILKRSSNSFHDCRNIYMSFKVKKFMKILIFSSLFPKRNEQFIIAVMFT